MSEMKTAQLVVSSSHPTFALGDTSGDTVECALTFTLRRNKEDNTLFFSNVQSVVINGESRKIGDSFAIMDDKLGKEKYLRVRLQVADSTKVFVPKAEQYDNANIVTNL